MKFYRSGISALALLALSLPASADVTGKVIGISDGDTITVLSERTPLKVRLLEIDAPEKSQPFGNRSKQSLSDLCFGKSAKLISHQKDRYGRILARVYCNGVDANAAQVRLGMAWVYDKYVTDMGLYKLQDEAKANRMGLWLDPNPVPPWLWRQQRRN